MKTKEEKLVQPDFIAEIPGIPIESDYQEVEPPNTSSQVQKMPAAQRTAAARTNAGLNMKVTTQIKSRGVDEGDDDASVIDATGSDDESEVENEDDHFPAEGVDSKIKSEPQDSGVPPQDAGLRRSSRLQTPGRKFIPTMTGQSHDEGVHEGVGFPKTAANDLAAAQEDSSILPPDVYDTVRGVLNI